MPRGLGVGYLPKRIEVSAYEIPTDLPEPDGTHEWDGTAIAVVSTKAASAEGYTFADKSGNPYPRQAGIANFESRPSGKFTEKSP